MLAPSQAVVHLATWEALHVFMKSIPQDELEPLVIPLRRSIAGSAGQTVPSFSLPKAVASTVPINEMRSCEVKLVLQAVEATSRSFTLISIPTELTSHR